MQRAAQNEIKNNHQQKQSTIQNSSHSSQLAYYPMDVANTLAA